MLVNLITIAAFVLIVGGVSAVAVVLARLQRNPIRERLAAVAGANGGDPTAGPSPIIDGLSVQLPALNLDNGELDRDLRRAGFYRPNARREYLALRNGMVLVALITTGVAIVMIGPAQQQAAIVAGMVGAVAMAVCWSIPRVYLSVRAYQRVERIRRGLPDALEMLGMCLTGGLSLQDSLGHVSRELVTARPDLAVELEIIRHQADMGSLLDAFQQFSNRIDAPEVVSMSSLITQSSRLGTGVAVAVREFVDTLRLQSRQLADERAGKASVLLLLPVALCLLPAVMILLWGPAILELWQFMRDFQGAPPIG